jgi:hypothetical protein
MRVGRLAVAACALMLASCAGDSQTVVPAPDHYDLAADQAAGKIGCSGAEPAFAVETVAGPAPDPTKLFADAPGRALRAFLDNGGEANRSGFIWQNGDWVVLERTEARVMYGYRSDSGLAFASVDTTTGRWQVRGYGTCGPRFLGTSTWRTDGHLDRNALFMLVNYDSGSSCYPPGDIVPVDHVVVTETATEIGLAVYLKKDEPPPGWKPPKLPKGSHFACGGVGMTGQTRVDLKAPVGDRTLLDYGAYPHEPPYA